MSIKAILKEIDDVRTAIESIDVLVTEHRHNCLLPTYNYLKEQKQHLSVKLSDFKTNIENQCEEVNRLSHI